MAELAPTAPAHPAELTDLLGALREYRAAPAELLTRETFAALLDVGVSTFDRLRETGQIGPRPVKLAGVKWLRAEALAWLRHRAPDGELHTVETWPAVWAALNQRN